MDMLRRELLGSVGLGSALIGVAASPQVSAPSEKVMHGSDSNTSETVGYCISRNARRVYDIKG